jgi:hypothetical protein
MGGIPQPLSAEDLQANQQAASVAASVTGDAIEAAARVEQITEDQTLAAAGVGGINRGLMKGMKAMNKAFMPRMGSDMDNMRSAGLPDSFILAASQSKVYAIEDKRDGGQLVPGNIIKEWDREGFTAKLSAGPALAAISRVPEDRQVLVLYLPLDNAKTKYMKAAAQNVAAAGSPGMPHKLMIAKDEPSQKLIDAIAAKGMMGAPNIMIGGQSLQDMMAQAQNAAQSAAAAAPAQADPATQLTQLADLHDRGVLNDEEFAAQKAKILGM